MLADRVQVAVRPRSILECLDLAVMFCGRRPLAVALAIAIGAVPCILLNRLFIAGMPADDSSLLAAFLLLGIEVAWASVPLTLYLGQAVFSERFSWRMATRSFMSSLPALVVFQGFLRAACLAILFLTPVVFIAMYYLNPVILLERPRLSRIWSRRGAINQRISGHIIVLTMVNAAILAVGVPLGTGFMAAVSSVWNGKPVRWVPEEFDESLVSSLFSWHGQIAFWSVCGLLTVFRFFTYLDARIRREGWDVELKLRSAATYAGLPEPRPHAMVGAAGWILAIVLATVSGTVLAVADQDGDAGSGAKRALARQSFPWYDAPADRYRSLIQPEQEATAASEAPRGSRDRVRGSRPGRGTRGGSGHGSGTGSSRGMRESRSREPWNFSFPKWDLSGLGTVIMVLLFGAAVIAIIYLVVRFGILGRTRRDKPDDAHEMMDDGDEERLAALPDAVRAAGGDLLAHARAYAERGEYEQAMIFYYAWQLLELDRRGGLVLARGKTNGQYVREVAAAGPSIAELFRRSSRLFEDAFFGDLPVTQTSFESVWNEQSRIASFARPPEPRSTRGGPRAMPASASRAILLAAATTLAATVGCQQEVDTTYAAVRGTSINGISAFVQLLRDTDHTVTARQYLPNEIPEEVSTLVVFDDSFAMLSPAAAEILPEFMGAGHDRTVLLVLRDSDCIIDYLRSLQARDDLEPENRKRVDTLLKDAEAQLAQATASDRPATAPFPDKLIATKRPSAGERLELAIQRRTTSPEKTISARWELRRRLAPGTEPRTLWSARDDPLLVRQKTDDDMILVMASAAPILNGGLVDPGNRLLAEELAALLPTEGGVLVVGSAGMDTVYEEDAEEPPSPWRLLTVQPLPWVAVQAIAAMALFCWCTSPIFGRPKRSAVAHAQDFGHHVAAMASLLAKSPKAGGEFARARIEAWRAAAPSAAAKPRRRRHS